MVRAGLSPWRLRVIATLFAVFGVLLVLRLIQVQILDHPRFEAEARDAHFWTQQIEGPRGAILDRNGLPLVTGVDTFEIHIDREAWELEAWIERLAVGELSRLLGVETETIRAIVASGSGRDVLLALNLPFALGETITAEGLPGVKITPASLRRYSEGGLASQLLGFVGRDNQGLAGVEFDFDGVLSGRPGLLVFERDSIGNPIPFGAHAQQATEPGADLVLTIDKSLQRIAEEHLTRALEETGARGGTILMMDPNTGDILAMASAPTFNVNELNLADANLDFSLFRNRGVTDLYEPGSVFKVITMAGALNAGVISPSTTFIDTGAIVVGARTIRNFDLSFHGEQTMTQVLQRSLNTGTAWVATQMGARLFYKNLNAFGFGQSTRSGLAGEAPGLLKEPGNLFWSEVDLATNSFGQGISVTPLQIVRAYSVIANGGELLRPRIVRSVIADDGVQDFPVVSEGRIISEEAAAALRFMMQAVVDGVSAHPAQTPGWPVAGKSGTSDIVEDGVYLEDESIASFAGFAPADDPRIVVLVKLDRPQGEIFGGVVAAPVFSQVLADVLPALGVPPTAYVAQPNLFDRVPEETGPAENTAERVASDSSRRDGATIAPVGEPRDGQNALRPAIPAPGIELAKPLTGQGLAQQEREEVGDG
jgi:cell division protein FtsI/penicillin-binding protein 2